MAQGFYKSYVDAVPFAAMLVDDQARVLAGNAGAIALNPHADSDRPLILVFRQPSLNNAVDACLRDGQPHRALYLHSEGPQEYRFEVRCAAVELAPVNDYAGIETQSPGRGVLICFQDVTDEQQLDQLRREFVANVSHELRTPLTAILGFVETLQGPARDDPKASARFLDIMAGEASRMNRLVGDLLSLSRVEEVSRLRPTDPVDVDQIVRSVVQNLSPIAQGNRSELSYSPASSPMTVPGDADQLMQVVTNLVENALKYGGAGTHVSITLDRAWDAGGLKGQNVLLSVADDGPGIETTHIARLTERFYRIDSHRSREKGGTGLGLAIVKHIVNRHRGRLRIDSELGKGSVFSVLIPTS